MNISPSPNLTAQHPPEPPAESVKERISKKSFSAGTLQYTLRGLVVLFLWLLWGDFAFTFFEQIFGRFIPLYLKDLHASNSLIGIMTGSFAGLVNILFLPNISQWSDNYRSRWGRRIPFLYVVTPLTVGALVAVGFAPEIATWLNVHILSHLAPGISITVVILTLLCVLVISFHFFNMVLCNAYNWLLRDVVPMELMARFLSWFRIVGTVSGAIFLWFVFPHVITYRREVCLSVGVFYLVSFMLMCRNVKEGEYPPPPLAEDRPGILKSFVIYFRECLSIPIYRNFFIAFVLANCAGSCASPFTVLFVRDILGLSMDDMGKVYAWSSAAAAVVYLPMGWLCDKFSATRIALVGLAGQIVTSVAVYYLVNDLTSFLICAIVFCIPGVAWGLGSQAMTMKIFPEEKFGQFSSGLNVFGCSALILGNYLVGQFMDLVHSDYRMIYFWSAALLTLAMFPMLLVYRGWKQHGGPDHYIAPLPSRSPLPIKNETYEI